MTHDDALPARLSDADILTTVHPLGRALPAHEVVAIARAVEQRVRAALAARAEPVYGIFDPDYARVFTKARCIARNEGYALAAHGSFTRDLDLLAVPWADHACDAEYLVDRIADACGLKPNGHPPGDKPHGRRAWTLLFPAFGDPRFIDLSVFAAPPATSDPGPWPATGLEPRGCPIPGACACPPATSAELVALIEAVDTLLESAPCECPHRMREERGEHLSHCYLFDLNVARSGAGEKR